MREGNKPVFGLLVLSFPVVIALSGCGAGDTTVSAGSPVKAAAATASSPRTPLDVKVFEVKGETKPERLVPAVLSTEATATVLAPRDGIIVDLRARQGAEVVKGEELARLSTEDLDAQLEQAELEVNRLSIEERQYEAMVQANQSERDQEAALLKDGLISKRQFDRRQYELDASVQELEKARLATETARSRIKTVKVDMAKCTIRAPMTGIVTQCSAKLGTSIVRNERLFEVARLSPLEVKFHLPLSDHARFGPGRVLGLSLVGSDRVAAQARIRRLDPVADVSSNSRGYWADVIGGAGLIPGMAVTVRLPREDAASTVSVPRTAFPNTTDLGLGASSVLFVLQNDRVEVRAVSLGAVDGDQVQVAAGLTVGDRVVLAPPAGLADGDTIRVISD